LASKTKNVGKCLSPLETPKDVTMNLSKLNNELETNPFLSIAIPAYGYNGKGVEFLNHSLNIIHSQTFKDFEVVISDHSTDDTIENLCYKWSSKLNIKYFKNEKGRGIISPNLNNALINCKGKWIKILFQDDYLYDDLSLIKIKNYIDSNPDTNWLVTEFWHTNDGIQLYRKLTPSWPTMPIWAGNNSLGCPSVLTIKNDNLILFNEDLNWLMDCEYYQRMYNLYGQPNILTESTMVNREVSDRLSNTISNEVRVSEFNKLKDIYG
jgi:hypothetical protein